MAILLQMPIAKASSKNIKVLTNLVNKCLKAEKKDIEVQNKIDQIVYSLYGLTQEEINVIESLYFYQRKIG
jgi:hypothetical protein